MLSFLGALWLGQAAVLAEQFVSDGIAVIVNEAIITYQDVERLAGNSITVLINQYRSQPEILRERINETKADATEQLIERQLILADFKSAGFNFPESIIEDTIQDRIKQQYRDRVTMTQSLRAEGMTYEAYRQRTREQIIIEAMRRKNLNPDILISPQRILNFYEQFKTNYAVGEQARLRMIVLNKKADDNGAAKQLAQEIIRKLDEGAKFNEMAKIYSEGARGATEGDFGWTERSVLRKELADVAFTLKPGQRSDVVELNDSCWVILVEEKREAHVRALAEVRDDIERILRQTESERLRKKWITRLKDKSFVRYF
ncbi:MAG TPA: peptidyl-prolyl cis-trans isomerase [Candidatus Acidoferrum sp.]|nr:peptidyl-prolyl cis-trans isomerase [Candidatus Acidoferrum sp.]